MTAALSLRGVLPAAAVPEWTSPLTLEVPVGSFYVMRTTSARSYALFRLCVGLTSPGQGHVQVLGTEPATLGRRGAQVFRRALGVGLLPHGLISNLTLRLNVVVPLVYGGLYRPDDAARRADEALSLCGLVAFADHRPADVPPEARQRAVIARAVARDPELLLLEDPVWSIDPGEADALLSLCRSRARTVIVATHRGDEVLAHHADHAVLWDAHGLSADAA